MINPIPSNGIAGYGQNRYFTSDQKPAEIPFEGGTPSVSPGIHAQDLGVRFGNENGDKIEISEKALKKLGSQECITCRERRYQDGSNDPGVSFKSPTRISPENAAAAVSGHEGEHVAREQSKAAAEDREIISQSVAIYTSVCPECGKAYVSGGETKTVSRSVQKTNNQDSLGKNVDQYI